MRSAALIPAFFGLFAAPADLAVRFAWIGVRVAKSNAAPMPPPED